MSAGLVQEGLTVPCRSTEVKCNAATLHDLCRRCNSAVLFLRAQAS